jgi:hypothetical protein
MDELREARGAPRTSINRPIGMGRRIAVVHVSLEDARALAHLLGVRLNDAFLFVVARSLRKALLRRGEDVEGVSLHCSVAVSQRRVRAESASGNHAGTLVVPVPLGMEDPRQQLAAIAAATARAKLSQLPSTSMNAVALLARSGLVRAYTRRQHMVNVLTTNVPGPPIALCLAGARISSPVALAPVVGNITVSFAALSYVSGLAFSVVADADAWPDFDALAAAMSASWRELEGLAPQSIAPAARECAQTR